MIPAAWQPTARVRQHRTLVRRRCKVQNRITSIKNTLRGILTRYNKDLSHLFSKVGREHYETIKASLLAEDAWVLDDLFEELKQQTARLKKVDDHFVEFAANAPVKEREARAVLDSMPGVGAVTIDTILAELGDWTRFRNADPQTGVVKHGHRKDLKISKAGSPLLRWIMIQLAHRMKRTTVRWLVRLNRSVAEREKEGDCNDRSSIAAGRICDVARRSRVPDGRTRWPRD